MLARSRRPALRDAFPNSSVILSPLPDGTVFRMLDSAGTKGGALTGERNGWPCRSSVGLSGMVDASGPLASPSNRTGRPFG